MAAFIEQYLGKLTVPEVNRLTNEFNLLHNGIRPSSGNESTKIIKKITQYPPIKQAQLLLFQFQNEIMRTALLGRVAFSSNMWKRYELLQFLLELIQKLRKDNVLSDAAVRHIVNAEFYFDTASVIPMNNGEKVSNMVATPLISLCRGLIDKNNEKTIIPLIQQILTLGANVNPVAQGTIPLASLPIFEVLRTKSHEGLKLLLENKANMEVYNENLLPLMVACVQENLQAVELLIQNGARVNAFCKRGYTALHYGAQLGNPSIVKLLLKAKADPNVFNQLNSNNERSVTPLMMAVAQGHTEIIKILGTKENVNQNNPGGQTALFFAKTPECIRALLEIGADLHLRDRNGRTALLHYASQKDATFIQIKCLIDSGSDVHVKDNYGLNLLHIVTQRVPDITFEDFAKPNFQLSAEFVATDLEIIKYLIAKKVDVNDSNNPVKMTPLLFAIFSRKISIVQYFLQGPNNHPIVDLQNILQTSIKDDAYENDVRYSPLRLAVTVCSDETSLKIVTLLIHALQKYAPIEFKKYCQSQQAFEELMIAAQDRGYLPLFKELMTLGIDIYQKDPMGCTLLYYVARQSNFELFKFLIEHSTRTRSKAHTLDWIHDESLSKSTQNDNIRKKKYSDDEEEDRHKFLKAIEARQETCARMLDAEYNRITKSRHKSIDLATDVQIDQKQLIDEKALKEILPQEVITLIEQRNSDQFLQGAGTPLFAAMVQGNTDLVKYLIDMGAKPGHFVCHTAIHARVIKSSSKDLAKISVPIANKIIMAFIKSKLMDWLDNSSDYQKAVDNFILYVLENIKYFIPMPKSAYFMVGFPKRGTGAIVSIDRSNCKAIMASLQEKIINKTSSNSMKSMVRQVLFERWVTVAKDNTEQKLQIEEDKIRMEFKFALDKIKTIKEKQTNFKTAINQMTAEIEAHLSTSEFNVNQTGYFATNSAKKDEHETNNRTYRETLEAMRATRLSQENLLSTLDLSGITSPLMMGERLNGILKVIDDYFKFNVLLEEQHEKLNEILEKMKTQVNTETIFLKNSANANNEAQKSQKKSKHGKKKKAASSITAHDASSLVSTSSALVTPDKKNMTEEQASKTFQKIEEIEKVLQDYQMASDLKQSEEEQAGLKQLDGYFAQFTNDNSAILNAVSQVQAPKGKTPLTLEDYSLMATKVEAREQIRRSTKQLESKLHTENLQPLLEEWRLWGNLGQLLESLKKLHKGANKLRNLLFYNESFVKPSITEIRQACENLSSFLKRINADPKMQKMSIDILNKLPEIDASGFLQKLSKTNPLILTLESCKTRIENDLQALQKLMKLYQESHTYYPLKLFQNALGAMLASLGNFASHLRKDYKTIKDRVVAHRTFLKLSKKLKEMLGISLARAIIIGRKYRHLNLIPIMVTHPDNTSEIQYQRAKIDWENQVLSLLQGPKFVVVKSNTTTSVLNSTDQSSAENICARAEVRASVEVRSGVEVRAGIVKNPLIFTDQNSQHSMLDNSSNPSYGQSATISGQGQSKTHSADKGDTKVTNRQ